MEGTDLEGSGADETRSSDAKRPESRSEKSMPQLAGGDANGTVAVANATTEPSPYVPIPAAGSYLPISPYSCIEQTASDSAGPSVATEPHIHLQETAIGAGEGTKTDGYVPWSSS